MTDVTLGTFIWYDLFTTDPQAACAFYAHVIGWRTQRWNDLYTLFVGGKGPIGGSEPLPEQARQKGARPRWNGNVHVADVDATVAQARKLGGRVLLEPADYPGTGRLAVIADPQGAALSLFKPSRAVTPRDREKPGEPCWHELLTTDNQAAFAFYSAVLGWQRLRDVDTGAMGNYLIYGCGGIELGGMVSKPEDMPLPPTWFYYIEVADIDAAITRARSSGGVLINGPMPAPVPGGARVAQLADPQGVLFGLHEAAKPGAG